MSRSCETYPDSPDIISISGIKEEGEWKCVYTD